MIRHSWASWHYAVHKDLMMLMRQGAWDLLQMADRYTHVVAEAMVPETRAFWSGTAVAGMRSSPL